MGDKKSKTEAIKLALLGKTKKLIELPADAVDADRVRRREFGQLNLARVRAENSTAEPKEVFDVLVREFEESVLGETPENFKYWEGVFVFTLLQVYGEANIDEKLARRLADQYVFLDNDFVRFGHRAFRFAKKNLPVALGIAALLLSKNPKVLKVSPAVKTGAKRVVDGINLVTPFVNKDSKAAEVTPVKVKKVVADLLRQLGPLPSTW